MLAVKEELGDRFTISIETIYRTTIRYILSRMENGFRQRASLASVTPAEVQTNLRFESQTPIPTSSNGMRRTWSSDLHRHDWKSGLTNHIMCTKLCLPLFLTTEIRLCVCIYTTTNKYTWSVYGLILQAETSHTYLFLDSQCNNNVASCHIYFI